MFDMILCALVGGLVAAAFRRLTPRLVSLHDHAPPFRFPWFEGLGAATFALAAWRFDLVWTSAPWAVFIALLLGITSTDLAYKLIPDRLSYPGTALGVVFSLLFPDAISNFLIQEKILSALGLQANALGGLALSVSGALVGFLILESIRRFFGRLVDMEVMGMGDSKLMMMTGAFLGPEMVLLALLPAVLVALLHGLVHRALTGAPHVAMGPGLAAGSLLTLLIPDEIVAAILYLSDTTASMSGPAVIAFNGALLVILFWLIRRMRKKAEEYSLAIEEDYERMEQAESKEPPKKSTNQKRKKGKSKKPAPKS